MNLHPLLQTTVFFGIPVQPPWSMLAMASIAVIPFVIIQLLWVRKGFKMILALSYYLAASYFIDALFFFAALYHPTLFGPATYTFVLGISAISSLLYGTLVTIAAIAITRNKTYFTR